MAEPPLISRVHPRVRARNFTDRRPDNGRSSRQDLLQRHKANARRWIERVVTKVGLLVKEDRRLLVLTDTVLYSTVQHCFPYVTALFLLPRILSREEFIS